MYHRVTRRKQTRILLYTLHQIRSKRRKVWVSTVDTDIIVIALSKCYELSRVGLKELWVEFGVWVNRRWIAVHRLAHSLLLPKCGAFPSWYALTGCDTVSSFHGKGKKSPWETWRNDCRRMLFTKKNKTVDNIPPTRNELIQRAKRAV